MHSGIQAGRNRAAVAQRATRSHERLATSLLDDAIVVVGCANDANRGSERSTRIPANIPPCDLLIIAGDICPDRIGPFVARFDPDQQVRWFDRKVRPWLHASPAVHKVATWGNHDWCGQSCDFSADAPGNAPTPRLQILVDEATHVPVSAVTSGEPPASALVIWATPWSNQFMDWAFMKSPADLASVYEAIPPGIDILVSHQPPYGYGDRSFDHGSGRVEHLGSRELLVAIDRVRPRLVISGHIHDGHGRYKHAGIPIYNVSVADDQYQLVHEPTVIDVE
jgi:calcineurin-like phosphoesterase family protein